MKLFYTPNSPYARIARVTALELNLGDRIEMHKVTVRDPNSDLLRYNPTGKVPTLATDDGFILSESRIIWVYLIGLTQTLRTLGVLLFSCRRRYANETLRVGKASRREGVLAVR